MRYDWRNIDTGEIVEHDHSSEPPAAGNWQRIFSFGVGKVNGAAGSPARVSPKDKNKG